MMVGLIKLRGYSKERGISLIETAIVIIILALILVTLGGIYINMQHSLARHNAAKQTMIVLNAVEGYVQKNVSDLSVNDEIKAGQPIIIDIPTLHKEGYLPEYFNDRNSWGQTYQGIIKPIFNQEHKINAYSVLIVTQGGQTLEKDVIGDIAMDLGYVGGVKSMDEKTIVGIKRGWNLIPKDWYLDKSTETLKTIKKLLDANGHIYAFEKVDISSHKAILSGVRISFFESDIENSDITKTWEPVINTSDHMAISWTGVSVKNVGIEITPSAQYEHITIDSKQTLGQTDYNFYPPDSWKEINSSLEIKLTPYDKNDVPGIPYIVKNISISAKKS